MSFPITLTYARNESRSGLEFVVNSDAIDIVQPSITDTPTSIRLRSGQTVYVAESVEDIRRAMLRSER